MIEDKGFAETVSTHNQSIMVTFFFKKGWVCEMLTVSSVLIVNVYKATENMSLQALNCGSNDTQGGYISQHLFFRVYCLHPTNSTPLKKMKHYSLLSIYSWTECVTFSSLFYTRFIKLDTKKSDLCYGRLI